MERDQKAFSSLDYHQTSSKDRFDHCASSMSRYDADPICVVLMAFCDDGPADDGLPKIK
jgi:hypothetical protein